MKGFYNYESVCFADNVKESLYVALVTALVTFIQNKQVTEMINNGYKEDDIKKRLNNASLETHVNRLVRRSDNRNRDEIEYHYRKFHDELKFNFSARAEIEETSIDTGKREIQEIGEQILSYLSLMTTSSKRA